MGNTCNVPNKNLYDMIKLSTYHLSIVARCLLALSLITLFIAACWPIQGQGQTLPWDKLMHAGAFAYLAYLCKHAFPSKPLLNLIIVLLIFGGMIEFAQGLTGYRDPSWGDFFANWVGVATGINIPPLFYCENSCRQRQ